MQQAFAYPFMYWVGMNTHPDTDPTAVTEFSQFYSKIHVPEVVASNPDSCAAPAMSFSSRTPVEILDRAGWRSTR